MDTNGVHTGREAAGPGVVSRKVPSVQLLALHL